MTDKITPEDLQRFKRLASIQPLLATNKDVLSILNRILDQNAQILKALELPTPVVSDFCKDWEPQEATPEEVAEEEIKEWARGKGTIACLNCKTQLHRSEIKTDVEPCTKWDYVSLTFACPYCHHGNVRVYPTEKAEEEGEGRDGNIKTDLDNLKCLGCGMLQRGKDVGRIDIFHDSVTISAHCPYCNLWSDYVYRMARDDHNPT